MPELTEQGKELRDNKFIQAFISNGGVATKAYKEAVPTVTYKSASVLGPRLASQLANVGKLDINKVLKEIGATPEFVLGEALKRAKNSKKDAHFLNTAKFLAKVGRWDQQSSVLSGLSDNLDLETIDIVRVRLKKKRKEERKEGVVDVDYKSTDDFNNCTKQADLAEVIETKEDK